MWLDSYVRGGCNDSLVVGRNVCYCVWSVCLRLSTAPSHDFCFIFQYVHAPLSRRDCYVGVPYRCLDFLNQALDPCVYTIDFDF